MIAVIADDFTGAAEIGGIGLRHGLKVIIETNVEEAGMCDLLIIAADTRSLSAEQAFAEIQKITKKLLALKPRFIFKKLDSVLRGNIEYELVSQMSEMGSKRAIVVAGNPSFDRLIKDGTYYVKGKPLAETFFSNDPEFPVSTSSVVEIIGKGTVSVISCKPSDILPMAGIIIGDVCCEKELASWANIIDNDTIFAGGAGFFNIILKRFYPIETCASKSNFIVGEKSLFVFGSMYPKSSNMIKQMNGSNVDIMNMPEPLFRNIKNDSNLIDIWASDITDRMGNDNKVVITVNHESQNDNGVSTRVKDKIGMLISIILSKTTVDDLLIEGGATTSVILKYLNISKLYPFKELDLGVIQMKVDGYPDLCITTKPGSYMWPNDIWISDATKN